MVLYVDRDISSSCVKKDVLKDKMDNLYEEVLFAILHNVGCNNNEVMMQQQREDQLNHLCQVFHMSPEKHKVLLSNAIVEMAPEKRLKVEIVEAKDLKSKDLTRLPNAYIALFLKSAPEDKHYTNMKQGTCNPEWEEHFYLSLYDDVLSDTLMLEVWDFEHKNNKTGTLQRVKSFRKLVKDFTSTSTNAKTDDLLIGTATIPLRSVTSTGMTMLYSLDKPNKIKKQGVIKLRIAFSVQKKERKDDCDFIEKQQELLKMLLLYEQGTLKISEQWCNNWSIQSEAILNQYRTHGGLSHILNTLCEWCVYSQTEVPLALEVFNKLLKVLAKPIQQQTLNNKEEVMFWNGAVNVLSKCFDVIHRQVQDSKMLKELQESLHIISTISSFVIPEGFVLFPQNTYTYLYDSDKHKDIDKDIHNVLTITIQSACTLWFNQIQQNACTKSDINEGLSKDEANLKLMICIIQKVTSFLQESVQNVDPIFVKVVQLSYTSIMYEEYEKMVYDYVKPKVDGFCMSLKDLKAEEDCSALIILFELYLEIQKLYNLGKSIQEESYNAEDCVYKSSKSLKDYHEWFVSGIKHWLDLTAVKAKRIVIKAIDMDDFKTVTDDVQYSTSATDSLAMFVQIKSFWEGLAWPDPEQNYTFITKIIRDIYECYKVYAESILQRLELYEDFTKWCVAINTIQYMTESLEALAKSIGDDCVIRMKRSREEIEGCKATIQAIIDNNICIVNSEVVKIIHNLALKLVPLIRKAFADDDDSYYKKSNRTTFRRASFSGLRHSFMTFTNNNPVVCIKINDYRTVINKLESILDVLHKALSAYYFKRIKSAVLKEISKLVSELIQNGLAKGRPTSFYASTLETLDALCDAFDYDIKDEEVAKSGKDKEEDDKVQLEQVRDVLKLHALETGDLIHKYHLERLEQQELSRDTPYGVLTVRCRLLATYLRIEIIHAKNLVPIDKNDACNPFIKVTLLPIDKFNGVDKCTTRSKTRTVFPLFDEKFIVKLSEKQLQISDAIICFSVKHKDYLGNQNLAQTFMRLSEVLKDSCNVELTHLTLMRPLLKGDAFKALEHRQDDKRAKDFLKKIYSVKDDNRNKFTQLKRTLSLRHSMLKKGH